MKLPSSGREAPTTVHPLDWAIVSHWAPIDLFSVAYLNQFTDLWCLVTENSSIEGFHQVRCFPCLKMEAESTSEASCFIKKIGRLAKSKKEDYVDKETGRVLWNPKVSYRVLLFIMNFYVDCKRLYS
jgi:hypothetical protein